MVVWGMVVWGMVVWSMMVWGMVVWEHGGVELCRTEKCQCVGIEVWGHMLLWK